MSTKLEQIKELTKQLNRAAKAYYQDASEIMTNYEYDKLYDELCTLEKEEGIVLSNSPTLRVGYEVLSDLPKERHDVRMLSLDKTKDTEALEEWLGEKKGNLSWKLDGLTIVLTYQNGVLTKAVTRGNGEVGEVITNNARVFQNIPAKIPYIGNLLLRGEAIIRYSDFEKINAEIMDGEIKYKNPRNLCSGSVRQLNNEITAKRNVQFIAFSLVQTEEESVQHSREEQLKWLSSMGFEVVVSKMVTRDTIVSTVAWFQEQAENDCPSDGLVLTFDDIEYGRSLGTTSKFPRDSIAFKWADEVMETTLIDVEWSASRTGLINPVAIFEPVELEGTTVSRASLHNISIMEGLELGIGDQITVFKANMIIPQVADNLTRSGLMELPNVCPVCKGETLIRQENDVKALYCPNNACLAKQIKLFTHFVSRDAMNIEGLSEATIEKLIGQGMLLELADLYRISKYHKEIVELEGFGEKSYQNLLDSLEKSKDVTLARFIYSLGIPNIGLSNAKLICNHFQDDFEKIRKASKEELIEILGIGEVIAAFFSDYFQLAKNQDLVNDLLSVIRVICQIKEPVELLLEGKVFVITGALTQVENRSALKEKIEQAGGKVTGSVTSKTDYLINNDSASSSSKNKKARELGIPILSEEAILTMLSS